MKKIITIIAFTLFPIIGINAQRGVLVETTHSQRHGGSIVQERNRFQLDNNNMMSQWTFVHNEWRLIRTYGPLRLERASYERGFFVVFFVPDDSGMNWRNFRNDIRFFHFLYDRSGGTIMQITEGVRQPSGNVNTTRFFTSAGHREATAQQSQTTQPRTSQATQPVANSTHHLQERDFDIKSTVLNSTSLSQMVSKINFSFEQVRRTTSNDGRFVTIEYRNNSLIRPVISYTISGNLTQIVLVMPMSNAEQITKELIRRFGTRYVNGDLVVQRGELIYDLRYEGDIGILVIRYL